MKIIFISLDKIDNLNETGIYHDLLRKFKDSSHEIYIVSPYERRFNKRTNFQKIRNVSFLNVWTPNIQRCGFFEKFFTTICVEFFFLKAIKKYIGNIKFDLILYATPPVTITNLIRHLKNYSNGFTYLLMKDIFPQNAVDLGMIKKKSIIYKYFRNKEKKLYFLSDKIGCTSEASVKYILNKNNEISKQKIEVNPNSADINNINIDHNFKLKNISLPSNKTLFIYGGNLGKPQGIKYLISNIENCKDLEKAFFIIVGSGTEYDYIKNIIKIKKLTNLMLINHLPKYDFDCLLNKSDVGLVCLDPKFTMPNFPSRMISYMKYKLPILFAIDSVTDCGQIAEDNGFGLKCINGDKRTFKSNVELLISDKSLIKKMGKNSYDFLNKNYNTDISYNIIMKNFLI